MAASKYVIKLANALNEFRKQDQLCDVTINMGGRALHAHKAVLAANSSYFMAMFTSGFSESTQSEISIDGNADIFEILLEFTYTGNMVITAKTAYDILEMACYMQFQEACELCSESFSRYIKVAPADIISIGDVYKIAKLASCHATTTHLEQLAQQSEKYMCKNVQLLKSDDEFLQMADMNFFNNFLEHKFLSSKEEEIEVLEMVVNWLKHDWSSRCTNAVELLQKVRLGFVPGETLKELLDATILDIPECKQLLEKLLRLQMSNHSSTILARDFPNLFATRSTITVPVILSSDDDGTYCCFRYYDLNLKFKGWTTFHGLDSLRQLASLIVVDGMLYAVGGVEVKRDERECGCWECFCDICDDGTGDADDEFNLLRECESSILCYDAEKNNWKYLPSFMKTARHSMLLVHMDGFIYAIGGSDEQDLYRHQHRYADRVERYDMKKKKWQDVASLPRGFISTSAAVFQENLLVYGVDSHNYQKHMLVVYNSNTNTWATKLSGHQDEVDSCNSRPLPTPSLFVHKDVCYRVLYQHIAGTVEVSVNVLMFGRSHRNVTIQVGEAIQQDQIPVNQIGVFRIQDEVFLNFHSLIYKTDLKISADQNTELDLDNWEDTNDSCFLRNSNGALFTIDMKRVSSNW